MTYRLVISKNAQGILFIQGGGSRRRETNQSYFRQNHPLYNSSNSMIYLLALGGNWKQESPFTLYSENQQYKGKESALRKRLRNRLTSFINKIGVVTRTLLLVSFRCLQNNYDE